MVSPNQLNQPEHVTRFGKYLRTSMLPLVQRGGEIFAIRSDVLLRSIDQDRSVVIEAKQLGRHLRLKFC